MILLNLLLWPISTATPVPNDSPYKTIFSDLTPFLFNHLTAVMASEYKLDSVGSPELPLKLLHEIIKTFKSSSLNLFNLYDLLNKLPALPWKNNKVLYFFKSFSISQDLSLILLSTSKKNSLYLN